MRHRHVEHLCELEKRLEPMRLSVPTSCRFACAGALLGTDDNACTSFSIDAPASGGAAAIGRCTLPSHHRATSYGTDLLAADSTHD
jgi:hypothetical protein